MHLIKIGNLIINASMLIEAEFTPAAPENDARLEPARTARLELLFAVPQSEERCSYHNGDYKGEEASPYCRTLYGEDAEQCWDVLRGKSAREK